MEILLADDKLDADLLAGGRGMRVNEDTHVIESALWGGARGGGGGWLKLRPNRSGGVWACKDGTPMFAYGY